MVTTAQFVPGPPRPVDGRRLPPAPCLVNPEVREAVQARRAVPPMRAVAEAMREGGDLVGLRLCRSPDPPLIYDVTVLRRDGRLVHVILDAGSGLPLQGRRQP